jgi:plastocyanin
VVKGRCFFDGKRPTRRKLPVQDAWCGSVGKPALSEDLIVDAKGGLAGVFVYVSKGLKGFTFPLVKDPIIIDQKNCTFVPHVAAVRVHQPVHFTNSDGTVHNINASASREGQGFVFSMSPAADTRVRQFPREELRIPIRCDVHSAMVMYVHVIDHPYFAISASDGTFEISQLPPGDYTLTAIHERCGRQSFSIHLDPNSETNQTLSFDDD